MFLAGIQPILNLIIPLCGKQTCIPIQRVPPDLPNDDGVVGFMGLDAFQLASRKDGG
jgi:hypothetical protein